MILLVRVLTPSAADPVPRCVRPGGEPPFPLPGGVLFAERDHPKIINLTDVIVRTMATCGYISAERRLRISP
jgi:hypothetical protein